MQAGNRSKSEFKGREYDNRPRCPLRMLGNSRQIGRELPRDRLVGELMQRRFDVALPPAPVIGFAAPFVPQTTTHDSESQEPAMHTCLCVMTRPSYRDQSPKGIYRGESKTVSGRDQFPGSVRVNPCADRGSRNTSTPKNMPRPTGSTVRTTRLQGLDGSDARGTDRSGSPASTG